MNQTRYDEELKRELGFPTAILVVVASMIGTGIFVTTGLVLQITQNSLQVLLLWGLGGIIAITGTLCYAELASMWPHVGGEYYYLKKIFGFLPSFLTGWISLFVGFSASAAISSITFVEYLDAFFQNSNLFSREIVDVLSGIYAQKCIASILILFFGVIHIRGVKSGSRIQNFLTLLKLVLVISLIVFGFYFADWSKSSRLLAQYSGNTSQGTTSLPLLALGLLIVTYSFSGWNGVCYIAGEIREGEKFIPRALFWGTLMTTVVYLSLNLVFLISSPANEIMGENAIGSIAAKNLFTPEISNFFTLGIALILLSSISVQMMIGPRVYYAMARDRMIFNSFCKIHPGFNTPSAAIFIQITLAVFYIFIGEAKTLMEYMGFTLSVFPLLAVIGLIYMRVKHPDMRRPYKVPLYPFVPVIFILLSSIMLLTGFFAWKNTTKYGLLAILIGIPLYFFWKWFLNRRTIDIAECIDKKRI